MADGISWLFVDNPKIAPKIEEKVDGEKVVRDRTLADDLRENVRPWWRLYPATNVLGTEFGPIATGFGLTRIRFAEFGTRVDPETFEEVLIERVRIVTPTWWQVYEREASQGPLSQPGEWVETGFGVNPLGVVPVVPIALGRYARPYLVKPPFLDLAYLNVRHWQSYSEQASILSNCRFAMLCNEDASFAAARFSADGNPSKGGELLIGPSVVLTGKWRFVEASGDGAAHGWKDLERLENTMAALSLQPFLPQRTGVVTATARALDASQANSTVQAWAMILKDALEQAFVLHAAWMDLPAEAAASVHINTDYGLSLANSEAADLFKLWAAGGVSRETLWSEFRRRGILSPTFTADVEEARMSMEGPPVGNKRDDEALREAAGFAA